MKFSENRSGIFHLMVCLWQHLERRRKRQFVLLFVLMLFSAFAEVATLSAVLPFLGVLSDPDVVFKYSIAKIIGQWFEITSGAQMVFPLTLLFIGIAFFSAGFRLFLLWVGSKLSHLVGVDLGFKVYMRTLYQPYHVHLERNSSVVINGITLKVDQSVYALNMALNMMIALLLITAVTVTLFVLNPYVALATSLIFGLSYMFVGVLFRRLLDRNGEVIARNSTHLVKSIQEGIGGIRDVLLDRSQPTYGEIYRRINLPLQLAAAKNAFFSGGPRYVMEAMGMSLIAGLAYTLSQQQGGMSGALPILGALALAAQRLLPNLQQAYGAWAGLKSSQAVLRDTLELLDQPLPEYALNSLPRRLEFTNSIQMNHLAFRYANDGPWILHDISLEVVKGSTIGVVGATGSGKSTMMDILMGLLEPQNGVVLVDGQPLQGMHLKEWQSCIAHVPQSVFLSDASIAENIAFGIESDSIDMERVKETARQAQLADFIDRLELDYKTMVGERGVRLSGGQRQRIGIARALYKQASVIVFDEATSALDSMTEKSVMDAIRLLGSDLTVFIIAHRFSTVVDCDKIIVLEDGKLSAEGNYSYLLKHSPVFQRLSGMSC